MLGEGALPWYLTGTGPRGPSRPVASAQPSPPSPTSTFLCSARVHSCTLVCGTLAQCRDVASVQLKVVGRLMGQRVGCFAPPPYSGSILPNLDMGSHNRRTAPPLTYFGLVSADLGFSQGDSPPNIQPHLALLRPPLGSASREPSPFAAVTTLWGRIAAQRYIYLHTRTRSWTTSRN